jgi:hypothetical protein
MLIAWKTKYQTHTAVASEEHITILHVRVFGQSINATLLQSGGAIEGDIFIGRCRSTRAPYLKDRRGGLRIRPIRAERLLCFCRARGDIMRRVVLAFAVLALAQPVVAEERPQSPLEALIATHAKANGVPESLVHRVIAQESRYNPRAVGRGGTMGLMQIKHATARGVGYTGLASGLLDPETNLTYVVRYLAGAADLVVDSATGGVIGAVMRPLLAGARASRSGQELGDPLGRMVGQAREGVGELSLRVDVELTAAACQ